MEEMIDVVDDEDRFVRTATRKGPFEQASIRHFKTYLEGRK